MPWKMWNPQTREYDTKSDESADLFDMIEQRYREYYKDYGIGDPRHAISREITPYSKERLKKIAKEDRAINTASEYLDAKSKRLFCRYCGEETTQINGDRTFCSHKCKQNMAYFRKVAKIKLAEEFREENQWQDSNQW